MSDIFLSYSHKDKQLTEEIVRAFRETGLEIFWDQDIRTGEKIRNTIDERIYESKCQIVLWTKSSIESDWVLSEAGIGNERGVLISISIGDTTPPMPFATSSYATLDDWNGESDDSQFKTIVADIRSMIKKTPSPTALKEEANPSQRSEEEPFVILDKRAMVSLGPASQDKYCSFSCPFCYVHSAYRSFVEWDVPAIIKWLRDNREKFDIVYISGDTDSFAGNRRRRESAIELVEAIAKLDVEIMITTRALIPNEHIARLGKVALELREKGLLLFGCVSIIQLHQGEGYPNLEPYPIPSVRDRIEQLEKFKSHGLISVLAMRPFLPVIKTDDYCQLIDDCQGKIDLVLGKEWYTDGDGSMDVHVFGDQISEYQDYFDPEKILMPFDDNKELWKVYNPTGVVDIIQDKCDESDIPFFMTSRPAVDWMRMRKRTIPRVIGIGALNVNFFAKTDNPENSVSNDEIKAKRDIWKEVESKFGSGYLDHFNPPFLGGGAYHAIECLRDLHSDKDLHLDYVGVAGVEVKEIYLKDHSHESFDVWSSLKSRGIGTTFVKRSTNKPGITINKWSGWSNDPINAGRNNVTNSYSNDELANYLETADRSSLVAHLASADWIHLSTLFEKEAMRIVSKLVSDAKSINLSLRVSWDVGSLDNNLLSRKRILRELLRAADFVVLSQRELLILAGLLDKDDKTNSFHHNEVANAAKTVFDNFSDEATFALIIQAPSFSRVDFFWKHRDVTLSLPIVKGQPEKENQPIDVTAASAYLSAAIIDSHLQPDLSFDMTPATEYGMDLVWEKLQNNDPNNRKLRFKAIRDSFEKRINSTELVNQSPTNISI